MSIEIGVICEIKDSKARVKIEEGLTTDFLHVKQFANSFVKKWTPLKIGEQVAVLPVRDDINSGFILRGFYCVDYAAPQTDEYTETSVYEDGTTISYNTKQKLLHVNLAKDATIIMGGNANINIGGDAVINISKNADITTNNAKVKASALTVDSPTSIFSGAVIANSVTVGGAGGTKLSSLAGGLSFDKSVTFEQNANVNGDLKVSGTITDSRGNLTNHTNSGYARD